MRVLLVANFYPPDSLGGVQLYTHGIARELQRRGAAVHVLCAGDWTQGERHLNRVENSHYDGVPVTRVHLNWAKSPDPFRSLYDDSDTGTVAQAVIDEFRPSLVHITSCEPLSASIIIAAKRASLPVVMTLAGYWFICPQITLRHADGHICNAQVSTWECTRCLAWDSKIYRWSQVLPPAVQEALLTTVGRQPWLSRQRGFIGMIGNMEDRRRTLSSAFAQVDVILSISRYVKDVFASSGQLSGENIRVHEWGLPTVLATQADRHAINSRPPLRIAYFGRVAPSKGVHVLINAFMQLHGDVALYLHGSSDGGSLAYDAQLRAVTVSDPRVHFLGQYQPGEAVRLMATYSMIVVPSTVPETYNLVAREALLAHTPVVASNVGAIPDAIWHERNGLLVEPNDVADLAAALQRLVDDPALRERLANGPRSVKTLEQEMDELMAIYCSLLPAT
ncbi:MAG: glycosyltransferase [Anaerolineae bacterium]|nr:glycosyltransferase [Anaerolineae bacterium]